MSKSSSSGSQPAGVYDLTVDRMQRGIAMLTDVRGQFDALLGNEEIDGNKLTAITRQFCAEAVDIFGPGAHQSKPYMNWRPCEIYYGNFDDEPEHVVELQAQKRFRKGAERTRLEIDTLIRQLQQKIAVSNEAPEPTSAAELSLLLQLCKRLPYSAKILEQRRKKKEPFKIQDEYDVQDLLQALCRAYFKYCVSEDPLSKLGGVSSRADFSIEELGALIELKYVHGPNDQERIVKEFAQDQQSYSQWPHLQHFIYVVYGSNDLKDPEALDKLAGNKSLNGRSFKAYIVRC